MNADRLRAIRWMAIAAVFGCLTACGCGERSPAPPAALAPPVERAAAEQPAGQRLPPAGAQPAAAASAAGVLQRETWDIMRIMGSRVGFAHTTVTRISRAGREALRIEAEECLDVERAGERIKPSSRVVSIETPEGQLLEFESEMQLGAVPMRTVGRVVGNRLEIETTSQGIKTNAEIPWSDDYGGPLAAEESLRRQPMQPGEKRTVWGLMPGFDQLTTVTMDAKDHETVKLPIGTRRLLRIDTETRLPNGQSLRGCTWMDGAGDVLKTDIDAMQTQVVRATRALALSEPEKAEVDFLLDFAVKVDRRLSDPHGTKRIVYRVQLDDGNPAEVFASGPSQELRPIDPHTAELTVYALRPGQSGGNPDAPADPPSEDDRQPNNFIQSDYPKIVALAKEVAGEQTDPWQVAVTLERRVYRFVAQKDLSQGLATAAEVVENPVGDCSEHAVLLAALARARGIPARVAVGLVYMGPQQSFGYHMWNEVYVEGRWIGLDATLGRGGIGAAHLKLAHSNLKDSLALSSFLPVIRVIGQLKIAIEEVE